MPNTDETQSELVTPIPQEKDLVMPFTNVDPLVITQLSELETGTMETDEVRIGDPGSKNLSTDKDGFFLGANTFAEAPFKVSMDGIMTAVAGKYIEQFTAGEGLTNGNIGCIKPGYTDIQCTADAYVNQGIAGADQNSNYGSADSLQASYDGAGWGRRAYWKFPVTGLPSSEQILKAEILLTVHAFQGSNRTITLDRVSSADWVENTITWANQPASAENVSVNYGDVGSIQTGASPQNTALSFDVTQTIRQMKDGHISNYGFSLANSDSGNNLWFYSREHATLAYRPILRVYTAENSDGKIYKASSDDYFLCRCIVGVVQADAIADAAVKLQTHGQVTNISTSTVGGRLYLSDTPGGYSNSTNNMPRVIKLGKITSASKFIWNCDDSDILIEDVIRGGNPLTPAALTDKRIYAPADTRYVKLVIDDTNGKQVFIIPRGLDEDNAIEVYSEGIIFTITWAANYFKINPSAGGAEIDHIQFYT